jgi:2',3'-cyclic-nucleotide 2'-phosphodiesterase (5'-nucleotidase family)
MKWKPKKLLGMCAALVILMGTACAVYNDSCPVTEPEVWGEINVELDIRRTFVRQCEAPVGSFIADSVLNYEYGLKDGVSDINPSVALINAGAIRDEVACGEGEEKRESIPKGPVTDQDILQLLPFDNTIVVVKMTGNQLKNVLEWGVSSLNLPGEESEEGHFLQVAGAGGITVEVDCNGDAQTLDADRKNISNPGSRIQSICIGTANPCFIDDGTYYVATFDYLVGKDDQGVPNDGFAALHGVDMSYFETNVPLTQVLRDWLGMPHATGYPSAEGRLTFQNCTAECLE